MRKRIRSEARAFATFATIHGNPRKVRFMEAGLPVAIIPCKTFTEAKKLCRAHYKGFLTTIDQLAQ